MSCPKFRETLRFISSSTYFAGGNGEETSCWPWNSTLWMRFANSKSLQSKSRNFVRAICSSIDRIHLAVLKPHHSQSMFREFNQDCLFFDPRDRAIPVHICYHEIQPWPNHALQRTAPGVTAPAPRRPTTQEPRRPPQSLSLGSLGVARAHRERKP